MTAPAAVEMTPVVPAVPAAVAPVVAPAAPAPAEGVALGVATPVEEAPANMQSVIDRITRRDIPSDTPADPAAPVAGGDAGAGAAPEAGADALAATPPVMVQEITADNGDTETLLRARDPKTGQFAEMDQTRTYELSLRDKATGEKKVYEKTLPELMRLAQDGIASRKQTDELTYYRQNVSTWQERHQQQETEIQGLRALAQELLSADESVVIARREAYFAEQTPEKQLARREAELNDREQRLRAEDTRRRDTEQQTHVSQQAQALASRIGPILSEVEGMVGKEAAAGQIALATMPLLVNGRIPPERFSQLEAYIAGPYRDWAHAQAAQRTTATADLERQRQQIADTQRKAQLAASQMGAATRPTGALGANAPAPALPKPKNVQETINRIISRPLAATG